MPTILIADTSVVLNIFASGHAAEILQVPGWRFTVCPAVIDEARFLRNRITGETQELKLGTMIKGGQIDNMRPESDEDFEWLLDFTATLGRRGEAEAMCFALAMSRKVSLATDDRKAISKARQLAFDRPVLSTASLFRQWAETTAPSDLVVATALQSVYDWACFKPPEGDPDSEWWEQKVQIN